MSKSSHVKSIKSIIDGRRNIKRIKPISDLRNNNSIIHPDFPRDAGVGFFQNILSLWQVESAFDILLVISLFLFDFSYISPPK